ncbi:MAG: sulfatase [Luteolibacter sp.]
MKLLWFLCLFPLVSGALQGAEVSPPSKPNILFVLTEDWSLDLGCYGNHELKTPNVDSLAKEGRLYNLAFCTAPVCSPSRSAMMTGFDQHTIGAQNHRTKDKKPLPDGIRAIPHLLADAGYYTCLLDGKTDCNFTVEKPLFMGKDWKDRQPGQPFFAQFTLSASHRPFRRDPASPVDPAKVTLPPYYPDTALVRRDWADGYEAMQLADRAFGKVLARLKAEGLEENTLVVFVGDNGLCHARGKQFLYEAGIHVPLVIRWPGHVKAGEKNDDLVSTLDIPASFLAVAGVKPAVPLQGRSLFDSSLPPRTAVFAGRDLMDETHDAMRVIRTRRYALIHNLMPERPWMQRSLYKEDSYPAWDTLQLLHLKSGLTAAQEAFLAPRKPEFELYDMEKDPDELHNLAEDPAMAAVKAELTDRLAAWQKEIRDPGVTDEFRAGGGDWKPPADPDFWAKRVEKFEKRLGVPAQDAPAPAGGH